MNAELIIMVQHSYHMISSTCNCNIRVLKIHKRINNKFLFLIMKSSDESLIIDFWNGAHPPPIEFKERENRLIFVFSKWKTNEDSNLLISIARFAHKTLVYQSSICLIRFSAVKDFPKAVAHKKQATFFVLLLYQIFSCVLVCGWLFDRLLPLQ